MIRRCLIAGCDAMPVGLSYFVLVRLLQSLQQGTRSPHGHTDTPSQQASQPDHISPGHANHARSAFLSILPTLVLAI